MIPPLTRKQTVSFDGCILLRERKEKYRKNAVFFVGNFPTLPVKKIFPNGV